MLKNITSSEFNKDGRAMRRIRSFVCRQGRLTKGRRQALEKYWPVMGVEYQDVPINTAALFGSSAPIVLEIGFGTGGSLVTMASNNPQYNFLGIEVYLPGVGACLAAAYTANLKNLRIIYHDAVEVLEHMIPDSSLDTVQLFFPDPWQKMRHNKRRIIQSSFVKLVLRKLKIHGVFHMATDWHPYAEYMLAVMTGIMGYYNLSSKDNYLPRPDTRPITKFELRGQLLGYKAWDLMFAKINNNYNT